MTLSFVAIIFVTLGFLWAIKLSKIVQKAESADIAEQRMEQEVKKDEVFHK